MEIPPSIWKHQRRSRTLVSFCCSRDGHVGRTTVALASSRWNLISMSAQTCGFSVVVISAPSLISLTRCRATKVSERSCVRRTSDIMGLARLGCCPRSTISRTKISTTSAPPAPWKHLFVPRVLRIFSDGLFRWHPRLGRNSRHLISSSRTSLCQLHPH